MMKSLKAGFTLAEVLTTLMVIGVVAAMTVPTLINSTDDQQNKAAVKKAVSVLGQAVQLLVAKEEECAISDAASLASCLSRVMVGTVNGDEITTSDGMVYKFYVPQERDDAAAVDFPTACGTVFFSDEAGWKGAGSCGVVVDINGKTKGTRAFETTNTSGSGPATTASYTFNTAGFTKVNTSVKDQHTFALNSIGVRPTYGTGNENGYNYLYGKVTGASDVISDTTVCCIYTAEAGTTPAKYESCYQTDKDTCDTGYTKRNPTSTSGS